MSEKANAGELNVKCVFKSVARSSGNNGSVSNVETNVFGVDDDDNDKFVMVKWVNAHGTESTNALQLAVKDIATITMRYSPLITEKLIVYKIGDSVPFEVKSVDNVKEKNEWMELKVQRSVPAR